jgi:hypothetical protein
MNCPTNFIELSVSIVLCLTKFLKKYSFELFVKQLINFLFLESVTKSYFVLL